MKKTNLSLKKITVLIALTLCTLTPWSFAQETNTEAPKAPAEAPAKKPALPADLGLSANIFFNYQYDASTLGVATRHRFDISRIHLRFSPMFGKHFRGTVMLDLATAAEIVFSGYRDTFVKEASLEWFLPLADGKTFDSKLQIGMQPSVLHQFVEGGWGHRYSYKIFMDQHGLMNTFDLGVSYRLKLLEMIYLGLGVFNGDGFKKYEVNKSLNAQVGLAFESTNVPVSAYVYHDQTFFNADNTNNQNQGTFMSAVHFKVPKILTVGADFTMQWNNKGSTNAASQIKGVTGFVSFYPIPKALELLARVDYYFADDSTKNKLFFMGGVQVSPVDPKEFAVMANYKHSLFLNDSTKVADQGIYLDAVWSFKR